MNGHLRAQDNERLAVTFVYAGIGLDRGALLAGPAATRSPAGSR